MFGVAWIFLSPLLMLAIFAFVFGHIFQARWPEQPEGMPFWLMLYTGLIVFNLFGETVSRAPGTVRSYPSYVKKIIFPVEILPLVPLGAGLVHATFNLAILAAALAWFGQLNVAILMIPVLIVPVLLLALGLSWFLAAWGVYIKDMTQIVPLFVQMALFLSPVLYPASAVPAFLRPLYDAEPAWHGYRGKPSRDPWSRNRLASLACRTRCRGRSCLARPRLLPPCARRVCRCPLTTSPSPLAT